MGQQRRAPEPPVPGRQALSLSVHRPASCMEGAESYWVNSCSVGEWGRVCRARGPMGRLGWPRGSGAVEPLPARPGTALHRPPRAGGGTEAPGRQGWGGAGVGVPGDRRGGAAGSSTSGAKAMGLAGRVSHGTTHVRVPFCVDVCQRMAAGIMLVPVLLPGLFPLPPSLPRAPSVCLSVQESGGERRRPVAGRRWPGASLTPCPPEGRRHAEP